LTNYLYRKKKKEINFVFSDKCITDAFGDIEKIRDGIEELHFKP